MVQTPNCGRARVLSGSQKGLVGELLEVLVSYGRSAVMHNELPKGLERLFQVLFGFSPWPDDNVRNRLVDLNLRSPRFLKDIRARANPIRARKSQESALAVSLGFPARCR